MCQSKFHLVCVASDKKRLNEVELIYFLLVLTELYGETRVVRIQFHAVACTKSVRKCGNGILKNNFSQMSKIPSDEKFN